MTVELLLGLLLYEEQAATVIAHFVFLPRLDREYKYRFGAAATSLDTLVIHALHMHTCLNRSSIAGRQSSSLNTLVSESCNSVYLPRRHTVINL